MRKISIGIKRFDFPHYQVITRCWGQLSEQLGGTLVSLPVHMIECRIIGVCMKGEGKG
ncbi:MAG: hypothetical protein GY702_07350 [Desulfobulbaceae bacterium]|nr:hypothetical protein [Desulfobulbaceae bacterium]